MAGDKDKKKEKKSKSSKKDDKKSKSSKSSKTEEKPKVEAPKETVEKKTTKAPEKVAEKPAEQPVEKKKGGGPDFGKRIGYEDMTTMENMTLEGVLENLQDRFMEDLIYVGFRMPLCPPWLFSLIFLSTDLYQFHFSCREPLQAPSYV